MKCFPKRPWDKLKYHNLFANYIQTLNILSLWTNQGPLQFRSSYFSPLNSPSFETQSLIPQLLLYINNHSTPLIYQRRIASINVVHAAKLFSVEDEWNVLGYDYKQKEAQTEAKTMVAQQPLLIRDKLCSRKQESFISGTSSEKEAFYFNILFYSNEAKFIKLSGWFVIHVPILGVSFNSDTIKLVENNERVCTLLNF